MWIKTLGLCAILLVLLSTLPVRSLRSRMLWILKHAANFLVISMLLGAAFFYVQPSLAPRELVTRLQPLATAMPGELGGDFGWVVFALIVGLFGLPFLIVIDFAHRLCGLPSSRNSARPLKQDRPKQPSREMTPAVRPKTVLERLQAASSAPRAKHST